MTDLLAVKASASMPAGATAVGTFVFSDTFTKETGIKKAVAERNGFAGKKGTVWSRLEGEETQVLVGLGDSKSVDVAAIRSGVASFVRAVSKHRRAGMELSEAVAAAADLDTNSLAAFVAESAILANYSFDDYRDSENSATKLNALTLTTAEPLIPVRAAIATASAVAAEVCFARDLVNTPGGDLTPARYADLAAERAREAGLSVEVFDKKGIEDLELGGVLAVNKGSVHPPRLLKLTYTPDSTSASGEATTESPSEESESEAAGDLPTVVLVGKGITFDSGGLSLKPPDGMIGMKMDMGGSAAVIAAMCALPAVQAPVRVVGITPMTDNMTGGDAQRPGDIYTAKDGTRVEVLNTDAEGRLILADALALAVEEEPDAIVDLATLTGACMVALGERIAGLMSNNDDFRAQVAAAAEEAGERMWPLPLPADYDDQLKSDVADVKNIGSRYGGSLTAGLFLKRFVGDDIPWAHIDIAGPAYASDAADVSPKGGTGFGVRTLVELLSNWGIGEEDPPEPVSEGVSG
jgi:leucyl aminopeptidase